MLIKKLKGLFKTNNQTSQNENKAHTQDVRQKNPSDNEKTHEKTRLEAKENYLRLIKVTKSTDPIVISKRAQLIYAVSELEKKLKGLDPDSDYEFADKIIEGVGSIFEEWSDGS